jgi:pyridoxamine 5'-phosphate oxidase
VDHDLPGDRSADLPDLVGFGPARTWEWLAAEMAAGVASARHPFHLFTVATVGGDGGPRCRTVVLRRFDGPARQVWFHTDARSPKVIELMREPRVCLHWYDTGRRVQIRLAAGVSLHRNDDVARAAWHQARPMSRACYTGLSPGSTCDSFPPAPIPPADDDERGLAAFTAACCRFTSIELLALHATGHQRVRLHLAAEPPTWEILAP